METITLVRWQRRRKGRDACPPSLWHIKGTTLNDRYGRTGCGKRFPRSAITEERTTHALPDGDELCALCELAIESEPES